MFTVEQGLRGVRGEAANGRRVYNVFNASPSFIVKAGEILTARFGFSEIKMPVAGGDTMLTTCTKAGVTLQLAWDNWTEFSVVADSPGGDLAVDEFADYVDGVLDDPAMQEFCQ